MIGVYVESWGCRWVANGAEHDLAHVKGDILYISFVNPQLYYVAGSCNLQNTGLSFSSTYNTVADAIDIAQKKGQIVMLSVGGATYSWDKYSVQSIVDLAIDLTVDGIDIDWEPSENPKAEQLIEIIKNIRGIGYTGKLSVAAFSVGAYGHGEFVNSKPGGSIYTGLNYTALKSVGDMLDWVNIMAYDAGITFDPIESYNSFKAIYKKKIYLGVEPGKQAWGDEITEIDDVKRYYDHVKQFDDGLFIWSLRKPGGFNVNDLIAISTAVEPVLPPPPKPQPIQTDIGKLPGKKDLWDIQEYKVGDTCIFKGKKYECRRAHKSQIDWTPDTTPALWLSLETSDDSSFLVNVKYAKGDLVFFENKQYSCVQSHVSQLDWCPGKTPSLWLARESAYI
jgi:chitinase